MSNKQTPPAKAASKSATMSSRIAKVPAAPAKRVYTKRKRTFTAKQELAVIKSVEKIGAVPTANKFGTLYIYVRDILDAHGVELALGRRFGS